MCIHSHRKKGEKEYGESKAKREDGFASISVLDVKKKKKSFCITIEEFFFFFFKKVEEYGKMSSSSVF